MARDRADLEERDEPDLEEREEPDLDDLDDLDEPEEPDLDELEVSAADPETLEAPDDDEPPPLIDDPDAGDRDGPAPTDPGITTTDDTIPCPYCGEPIDLFLEPPHDTSRQEFVEECSACSRDVEVTVQYDDAGTPHIHAGRSE